MSASSCPTNLYVISFPVTRSFNFTVAPKITLPLFSILVTSMTFARAIKSLMATTLLSIKACCSFAA